MLSLRRLFDGTAYYSRAFVMFAGLDFEIAFEATRKVIQSQTHHVHPSHRANVLDSNCKIRFEYIPTTTNSRPPMMETAKDTIAFNQRCVAKDLLVEFSRSMLVEPTNTLVELLHKLRKSRSLSTSPLQPSRRASRYVLIPSVSGILSLVISEMGIVAGSTEKEVTRIRNHVPIIFCLLFSCGFGVLVIFYSRGGSQLSASDFTSEFSSSECICSSEFTSES